MNGNENRSLFRVLSCVTRKSWFRAIPKILNRVIKSYSSSNCLRKAINVERNSLKLCSESKFESQPAKESKKSRNIHHQSCEHWVICMEILPHTGERRQFCYNNNKRLQLFRKAFGGPLIRETKHRCSFLWAIMLAEIYILQCINFLHHLIWLLTLGRRFLSARAVKRDFYRRDIEFFTPVGGSSDV